MGPRWAAAVGGPILAKILVRKLLVTESRVRWVQTGNVWSRLLRRNEERGGWMAGVRLGPVGWLGVRGGWIGSGARMGGAAWSCALMVEWADVNLPAQGRAQN